MIFTVILLQLSFKPLISLLMLSLIATTQEKKHLLETEKELRLGQRFVFQQDSDTDMQPQLQWNSLDEWHFIC